MIPGPGFSSLGLVLIHILPLFLIACYPSPPETAPLSEAKSFEENGPPVQGDFLLFFNRYGGPASLGQPLTGEIRIDGWRVQYFEKGRLEYHPENEAAYRITVGWLGELLHRRRPPLSADALPPDDGHNHRYYPQTGHSISGDFLTYFDSYGGSVRFGLPISEPFLVDGRLTQDFQSARFFWTPEQSPPVTLEDIGRVHLETRGKTIIRK